MLKSELLHRLALRHLSLSDSDIYVAVDLIHRAVSDALVKRKRVEIRDFGVFEVNHRKPRSARNPKTGEKLLTRAKYIPHFRPGKELRERVEAAALRGESLPKVERRRTVA